MTDAWIMPMVSPMVLYAGTVIMSAGTFLAVLGYVLWHEEYDSNRNTNLYCANKENN